MSEVSVIIVDRDRGARAALRAAFASLGCDCLMAGDIAAAQILLSETSAVALLYIDADTVSDIDAAFAALSVRDDWRDVPKFVAIDGRDEAGQIHAFDLGASDVIGKPYLDGTLRARARKLLRLRAATRVRERDILTGLLWRGAFFERAASKIAEHEPGFYMLSCFDIDAFKLINDIYGSETGDKILLRIARTVSAFTDVRDGLSCRMSGDNFAFLYPQTETREIEALFARLTQGIALDGVENRVNISVGCCAVDEPTLPVSVVFDRAMLAKRSIKGRYDQHIAYYSAEMRDAALAEQWIVGQCERALLDGEFDIWLQPQFNHVTGAMIGAEVLVRWCHPEKGVISPSAFISIFECTGFIYALDQYVWGRVCVLLRRWLDEGRDPLPLSVNVSRYDIFREGFFDYITGLVRRYDLPLQLFRIEITESAFAESSEQIIETVAKLRERGFIIEIDDFGSGYSSLNTLNEVPAHILKLDMRFLERRHSSPRGGNILESIVRMAKWLNMPVIAEGAETRGQADYLRSIGCSYVQGYLYAWPMPVEEYEQLWARMEKDHHLDTIVTDLPGDSAAFWDPDSIDTLVFNHYVGGACVFEFSNDTIELLRVNELCVAAFNAGLTEEQFLRMGPLTGLSDTDRDAMLRAVSEAAETGDSVSVEVEYKHYFSADGHEYLRYTLRRIADGGDRTLFYANVENITARRQNELTLESRTQQMRAIVDQISVGIAVLTARDGALRFTFMNGYFYEMLGYEPAQFADAHIDPPRVIHRDDIAFLRFLVNRSLALKQAVSHDCRCIKRDGTEILLHCEASAADDADDFGEDALLCVFTDVTTQKGNELALVQKNEQLLLLDAIAHDLLAETNDAQAMSALLTNLLRFFEGQRVFALELDDSRTRVLHRYEADGQGVSSPAEAMRAIPEPVLARWVAALDAERCLQIRNVSALGDDRAAERDWLLRRHVRAVVVVPLRLYGRTMGLMWIENPMLGDVSASHITALGDYAALLLARARNDAKPCEDVKPDEDAAPEADAAPRRNAAPEADAAPRRNAAQDRPLQAWIKPKRRGYAMRESR